MITCRVIGSIVSTIKHPVYSGKKVLLCRPTHPDGTPGAGTIVAVDAVDAGVGDWVLVAAGGGAASDVLGLERRVPVRSVVVGIIDSLSMEPSLAGHREQQTRNGSVSDSSDADG